jgi:hypothetical protein
VPFQRSAPTLPGANSDDYERIVIRTMSALETIRSVPWGWWLGLAGGAAFAVIYSLDTRRAGLALIQRWASLHRYQIVRARRRTFVPLGGQWKGISFFRVSVRDGAGELRSCWLRFHDLEDEPKNIEVIWDGPT